MQRKHDRKGDSKHVGGGSWSLLLRTHSRLNDVFRFTSFTTNKQETADSPQTGKLQARPGRDDAPTTPAP